MRDIKISEYEQDTWAFPPLQCDQILCNCGAICSVGNHLYTLGLYPVCCKLCGSLLASPDFPYIARYLVGLSCSSWNTKSSAQSSTTIKPPSPTLNSCLFPMQAPMQKQGILTKQWASVRALTTSIYSGIGSIGRKIRVSCMSAYLKLNRRMAG